MPGHHLSRAVSIRTHWITSSPGVPSAARPTLPGPSGRPGRQNRRTVVRSRPEQRTHNRREGARGYFVPLMDWFLVFWCGRDRTDTGTPAARINDQRPTTPDRPHTPPLKMTPGVGLESSKYVVFLSWHRPRRSIGSLISRLSPSLRSAPGTLPTAKRRFDPRLTNRASHLPALAKLRRTSPDNDYTAVTKGYRKR